MVDDMPSTPKRWLLAALYIEVCFQPLKPWKYCRHISVRVLIENVCLFTLRLKAFRSSAVDLTVPLPSRTESRWI